MPKVHCPKSIEQFWAERTKARIALDKKRANASYPEKIRIMELLRKDALLLKTGRIKIAKS